MSKRKFEYPTAGDLDTNPDSTTAAGGQVTGGTGGGDVSEKAHTISSTDTSVPTHSTMTFKRLFNQYITNTVKRPEIDDPSVNTSGSGAKKGYIYWHWFRVPVDDLRFYLTPRTVDYIITSGTEFKINYVEVELKQFTVFTDHIMPTATGEKFTQFPTSNPFVFLYEDNNYYLPQRDVDKMEEWEIKSNFTYQDKREDCTLKEFVSALPAGMNTHIEDCNLLNTQDWSTHELQQPIQIKRNVNMPFVSVAGNLYYEAGAGDISPIQYQFPYINSNSNNAWYSTGVNDPDSKGKEKLVMRRATNMKDRSGKQQLLTDGKPFGEPLKEFLIKPVPYTDIMNNPILYSIEFYATYTINVTVRSSPMLYRTPRLYPTSSLHWAGKRNYGMGNVLHKLT